MFQPLVFAIDITLPNKPTAEESAFVATVEKAILSQDVNTLLSLDDFDYTDSNLQWAKKVMREFYQSTISKGCLALKLERVDPNKETEYKDKFGASIKESLPVQWMLTITHKPPFPGANVTTVLKAGNLNGKIRITHQVSVDDGA
jgi:hypothetical protein